MYKSQLHIARLLRSICPIALGILAKYVIFCKQVGCKAKPKRRATKERGRQFMHKQGEIDIIITLSFRRTTERSDVLSVGQSLSFVAKTVRHGTG